MAQCVCPNCQDHSGLFRVYISDGSDENTRWVASFGTREEANEEQSRLQHSCDAFTDGTFSAFIESDAATIPTDQPARSGTAPIDFSDIPFADIHMERCYFCEQLSAHVDSAGLCRDCEVRCI